jgi:peptidyl-prolyl cis-trans isomerase B (cyclophilin B)
VQNFALLSQHGYYNGVKFHRVIEDMLIQSGSFDGTAQGGKSIWELEFEDEFSDQLHHYNGALAMANHGEDTNGSQFYFVTGKIGSVSDETVAQMTDAGWRDEVVGAYKQAGGLPSLDWRYTVFGQIYEGLDVAYEISRVKTDNNGKPEKDVVIESIAVYTVE